MSLLTPLRQEQPAPFAGLECSSAKPSGPALQTPRHQINAIFVHCKLPFGKAGSETSQPRYPRGESFLPWCGEVRRKTMQFLTSHHLRIRLPGCRALPWPRRATNRTWHHQETHHSCAIFVCLRRFALLRPAQSDEHSLKLPLLSLKKCHSNHSV